MNPRVGENPAAYTSILITYLHTHIYVHTCIFSISTPE